ncbi:hypothetical protein AAE478_004730 [Parahypoxylon ruwenzoriense]
MATPAHIEEGYEMNAIYRTAEADQQLSGVPSQRESAPRDNNVYQGTPSVASLGTRNFLTDFDITNTAPKGWPSFAAIQMYRPNFSIHRRFSCLMQRVLIDQETKLAYLENKIEELDREDDRGKVPRLKSLPFDPDRLLATYARARAQPTAAQGIPSGTDKKDGQEEQEEKDKQWEDKDLLLEAVVARLKTYLELLQLDKEMQKLPRISRREHKVLYNEIRKYHIPDGPAHQFLYPKDDFITTIADGVHQYFEGFLYGKNPIISSSYKRIKRLIGRIDKGKNRDHPPVIEINKRLFVVLIKVIVAFTSGVLLLSPIAILFLVDLSRAQSFGVVVSFLFLFVAVMSSLNTNWDTILVGLSAYMAVLVTFLSNLEQRIN